MTLLNFEQVTFFSLHPLTVSSNYSVIVTTAAVELYDSMTVLQFPRGMMNARVQVRPSQSIWPG